MTTGGGKTATIEGEHQIGQGGSTTITGSEGGQASVDRSVGPGGTVTREGTYTKNGQTVDTTTKRSGDTTATKAQGSDGGQAASISNGGNRTTVGQSGSGDVYAGHNGNVYKKTDNGWQHYDQGGWKPVDTPDRTDQPSTTSSGQRANARHKRLHTRASQFNRASPAARRTVPAADTAAVSMAAAATAAEIMAAADATTAATAAPTKCASSIVMRAHAAAATTVSSNAAACRRGSSRGGFSRGGGRGGGGRRR